MKIKKIVIVISMLAVMFSLSGCDDEKKAPFEYDDSSIVLDAITLFDNYADVSEEYAKYYIENGTDLEKSAVNGIRQAIETDKVGTFQDYSIILSNQQSTGMFSPESVDYEIEETEEAVLVTVLNRAEKRDVKITVKYVVNPDYFIQLDKAAQYYSPDNLMSLTEAYGISVDDMMQQYGCDSIEQLGQVLAVEEMNYQNIKSYTAEEMVVSAVYSKKELMASAGRNTLIGMGTVFVVLIFISFIISRFKFLPALLAPKPKLAEIKEESAKKAPAPVASAAQDENPANDEALVAVIMAAIYAASAESGNAVSRDKLVVRSIKRVRK
ncbi:MAG: OadG family protein [Clostridium sp.]|nr:OadG family protein [Clostridium sp.]MCM1400159.1 OadG family protein [Clostridium sp.]MCM1460891.1 OadG family protein [Bacteroides sp.]